MSVSDFRSDTVTRPTDAMRRAMAEAEVGDDVLDGDPTVRRLEERMAGWLGKEAALFVPSGTMANQVAVGSWTGALPLLHGVQTLTLEGRRGALDPDEVERSVRPDYVHCPRTALVCLEQTHMNAGGRVLPLENVKAVARVCREHGLPLHLDGARLPNAVVASGVEAAAWSAQADSVSVCLSKGLGAPVGSVVAGDAAFGERARVLRKQLGGWMRQSGVLAAAALVALDEGLERLGDDHHLAREIAAAATRFRGLTADPEAVETNIAFVDVEPGARDGTGLARELESRGIRVLALGPRRLRFVTHRDVGPADLERLVGVLGEILG